MQKKTKVKCERCGSKMKREKVMITVVKDDKKYLVDIILYSCNNTNCRHNYISRRERNRVAKLIDSGKCERMVVE